MKSKTLLIAAGIVVATGLLAWYILSGSSKHLKLIPIDATVVVSFDIQSIYNKMDKKKVEEMNWYKEFIEEKEDRPKRGMDKILMTILKEKRKSGVDVLSDVYFFAHNVEGEDYNALVFSISDDEDFIKTLKGAKEDVEIILHDTYKMVKMSGNILAWNDDAGIIFDSHGGYSDDANWNIQFLDWTFGRYKETSILNNDEFDDYGTDGEDITLFVNGTALYDQSTKARGMEAAIMKNMMYMKDTYIVADLNFDDDAIVVKTRIESDNPDYEKIQFLKEESISDEHLKLITGKDVFGLWTMNINLESIYNFYRDMPGFEDVRNEATSELGISEEQLKMMMSGEASAALVGFKMEQFDPLAGLDSATIQMYKEWGEYEYLMRQSKPELVPVFTSNLAFNDKETMRKILQRMVDQGIMTVNSDGIFSASPARNYNIHIAETSIGLIITNDADLALKAKSGGVGDLPENIKSLADDNPMAIFWNLHLEDYPEDVKSGLGEMGGFYLRPLFTYYEIFKDVTFKAEKNKSEWRLNLMEGEGNSLYQLLAQGEKAYLSSKQRD